MIAAGGDIAVSPDNIDTNAQYLVIQEDSTGASRPVMASKGRDGSIRRLDLNRGFAATRVDPVEPAGPGRRGGQPRGMGDQRHHRLTRLGSYNSWLFDVQAQPPTQAPAPNTVEDGQIALLRPPGSGPAFPALLPTATILQLGRG